MPRLRLVDPTGVPQDDAAAAREAPAPVDLASAYRAHGAYVTRVAIRFLGRSSDVEDVVQEVFLDAIRGMERLRHPEAARGWLVVLTVRKARALLKKRRALYFLGLDDGGDYAELADAGASPEQSLRIADLYRLLDGLPTEQRLAWTLRYLENERLEQVAAACECSLATAKRRIAAAHAVLAAELSDD